MMGAAVLEHQKMRLLSGGDTGSSQQEEVALGSKIKTLKEIALVLIKELETLGETQPVDGKRSINLQEEVRRFEIDLIQRALRRTGGNQVRAARLLGMKVTTLNSKIIRYGINPDEVAGNLVEPPPQGNISALEQV
jgi:transcriptional regulator with GAF, ATPase, and Fis domain